MTEPTHPTATTGGLTPASAPESATSTAATTSGRVVCEVAGPIATLTLSNPARRNAMTAAMWQQIPVVLKGLADDPAVRAVVVTGDGEHFCAGADITDLNRSLGLDRPADPTRASLPEQAEEALAAFPKPTIAVIRGSCVGGGVELALACDLRQATQTARFGITPARLGIIYPPRATARLVTIVGPAVAKRLLFTADLISAERAWQAGLVDRPVPDHVLAQTVEALLATLMSRSQLSLCGSKAIVDAAAGDRLAGPDGALHQAEPWLQEMAVSSDPREGITAFLQHRAPEFTWR